MKHRITPTLNPEERSLSLKLSEAASLLAKLKFTLQTAGIEADDECADLAEMIEERWKER